MIDKDMLKSYLIRDKVFLKSLYDPNSAIARKKKILSTASDTELDTLLHYTHFVTTGQIRIKKDHFNALLNEKKLQYIRNKTEKQSQLTQLFNEI
jgi:hypothetical protein